MNGIGNKLRALQSSYILSCLLERPLYISYPLYHNCFLSPDDVVAADPSILDSLSPAQVFVVESIDDLDVLFDLPVLPLAIVTGKGFSLFIIYILALSHSLRLSRLVAKCSSLFAKPSLA